MGQAPQPDDTRLEARALQQIPLEPIELSREMRSELVETMAEINQLVDLDSEGFVVAASDDP